MTLFAAIAAFILFLPFAEDISMRYFIVILFWPFVLAGFWLKCLLSFKNKAKFLLAGILVPVFIAANVWTYWHTFPAKVSESDMRSEFFGGIRLGDAEGGADFIIDKAQKSKPPSGEVYLADFEYAQSLSYLIKKKSKLSISILQDWPPKENITFFFMKKSGSLDEILNKKYESFAIEDYRVFERFAVFKAVPKSVTQ
jgi:hypothetical protein